MSSGQYFSQVAQDKSPLKTPGSPFPEGSPRPGLRRYGDSINKNEKPDDQYNAWELYNETAMDYDRQMLKEWEGALSTLLIFVRILIF
jgi:hypothetical protein